MFETWIALAVTALVTLCAAWGLTYRMRKYRVAAGPERNHSMRPATAGPMRDAGFDDHPRGCGTGS